MNHWATKYVGLPYCLGGRERDGVDCWGLVRLVYREERGVLLPDLPGVASCDLLTISHRILREAMDLWQDLAEPKELCAVAMSQSRVLHHVGVWTAADGGKVIHAWKDLAVIADTLRVLRLRGFRTIKFFSYGLHH